MKMPVKVEAQFNQKSTTSSSAMYNFSKITTPVSDLVVLDQFKHLKVIKKKLTSGLTRNYSA